jgi:hypothetical protein
MKPYNCNNLSETFIGDNTLGASSSNHRNNGIDTRILAPLQKNEKQKQKNPQILIDFKTENTKKTYKLRNNER